MWFEVVKVARQLVPPTSLRLIAHPVWYTQASRVVTASPPPLVMYNGSDQRIVMYTKCGGSASGWGRKALGERLKDEAENRMCLLHQRDARQNLPLYQLREKS